MWLAKRILYLAIILLAIILARYKKKLPTNLAWVYNLLIITFGMEICAISSAYVFKNNSFIYMVFGIVQILMIYLIYSFSFISSKHRQLASICTTACLVAVVVTIFLNKAWIQVNSEGNAFKSLFVVLLCLLLFTDWLKYPRNVSIITEPMFWINTGFFLFFSINIFFWIGYNFLSKSNMAALRQLEPLQYSSNLYLYSCILYSFVIYKNKNI